MVDNMGWGPVFFRSNGLPLAVCLMILVIFSVDERLKSIGCTFEKTPLFASRGVDLVH